MVNFIIKEKEGIVVAVISDTSRDAEELINRHSRHLNSYVWDMYTMKDRYVGVARCHKLDKFDVETGKEIALRRALKVHHRDLKHCVERYLQELDRIEECLKRKLDNKFSSSDEKLNELLRKLG